MRKDLWMRVDARPLTVLVAVPDGRQATRHVEDVAEKACNAVVDQLTHVCVGHALDGVGLFLAPKDFGNLAVAVRRRGRRELKDYVAKTCGRSAPPATPYIYPNPDPTLFATHQPARSGTRSGHAG